VIAIAASTELAPGPVPVFSRDDVRGIADFITARTGARPAMNQRRLLDDCFLHDRDRLRHADALKLLDERLEPVAGIEDVALTEALGRVLAEDIAAPRPIPAFTNSAVDGYAFAHASLGSDTTRLRLTGRAAAGHATPRPLGPGEAARIFTGAVMPEGADSCIMQEDVEVTGEFVVLPPGLKAGANTRKAGEDLQAGETAARTGARLRPQELAAIASTGRDRIRCYRRLRIALISTGDEIVRPGAALAHGQVYDSNHALLLGLSAHRGGGSGGLRRAARRRSGGA
jgi:molybdopterin molybdotransferase